MWLGALCIYVDLAATAGVLSFRTGLEQTGDIQPDIEPDPSDRAF